MKWDEKYDPPKTLHSPTNSTLWFGSGISLGISLHQYNIGNIETALGFIILTLLSGIVLIKRLRKDNENK